MAALTGNGPSVELADGPHTIRYSTRRLVVLEKRYGGFEELQTNLLKQILEVTAALLWASSKGDTEDDAMDAMDGTPVMRLAEVLMVEYARAYAGDEAAEAVAKSMAEAKKKAEEGAADDSNGQAPDPTNGATPRLTPAMAASPSPS